MGRSFPRNLLAKAANEADLNSQAMENDCSVLQ